MSGISRFYTTMLENFLVALGVLLGGSIVGSLHAIFNGNAPLSYCLSLAEKLKIWAMVAALGGTFHSIRIIESSVLSGQAVNLLKQLAFILAAFLGAQLGFWLLSQLLGGQR